MKWITELDLLLGGTLLGRLLPTHCQQCGADTYTDTVNGRVYGLDRKRHRCKAANVPAKERTR